MENERTPHQVLTEAAGRLADVRRVWEELEPAVKLALEDLAGELKLTYGPEAFGRLAVRFELGEMPGIIGVRAAMPPALAFAAEVSEDGRRQLVTVAELPIQLRPTLVGGAEIAGDPLHRRDAIAGLLAAGMEGFIAAHAEARLPRMGG